MDAQIEDKYENKIQAPFTDCLTGLFNHGILQLFLDREISRFHRYGTPFTLGLIDVDSFCGYNNRHGALQADRMLKEIGGAIKANIRRVDIAARFAGDIFAVILTGSDAGPDLKAAERIRNSVEQLARGELTVSLGLAAFPRDAAEKNDLIRRAVEAVKEAKIRGKNRVFCFTQEKEVVHDSHPRILIVDDEPRNLKLLEALLVTKQYEVVIAANGEEALDMVTKVEVDLVLLDIMMPGMDGFEVCRHLKAREATRMIPIILITALDDMESKVKGIEAGADDFISKPPNKAELLARTRSLVKLKKLNNNLTDIENVLFSLANTVEAKDAYTQGHIERVANLAVALGRKMRLSSKMIEALRFGGVLHDIGKIGMPGEILNKPGPLNEKEWKVMQTHPEVGYKICLPLKRNLGAALDVIRHHHEKLDGSGYPDGLKGDTIPVVARIMAVADIYDALVTDRPYRKGLSKRQALEILRGEAEKGKLDPEIVECLVQGFE